MGRIKARPRVPDPALIWIDGAGLDRPPRRLGPKRRDPHDGLRVDAVLAEAQVGAGDRVRGPGCLSDERSVHALTSATALIVASRQPSGRPSGPKRSGKRAAVASS